MNDPFALAAPEEALRFLRSFDRATRRNGENYFHQNRVSNLVSQEDGTALTATVRGSRLYEVDLEFDPQSGWWGECACPIEVNCKHVYAAMKAALAEHSVAAVRKLSAGLPGQVIKTPSVNAGSTQPKGKKSSENEQVFAGDFGQKVVNSLGRPLRPEETAFLRKLNQIYRRCCQSRRISCWDFDELGLSLGGYGWNALQIWPAFPQNEEEFWLYLANAAIEHRRKIPDFLQPVTDLGLIQDRLHRWRRGREIDRWKHTLGNHAPESVRTAVCLEADLRLVLRETAAEIQWKRMGKEDFEDLKAQKARQFAEDIRNARFSLPPEAEVLWETLDRQLFYGRSLELNYSDAESRRALGRLLRLRLLDSRIVSARGHPLARVIEPLRWEVMAAASDAEDYRFHLVQTNGTPPPRLLCTLPGYPPLYLTSEAVFVGPPASNVLDPAVENAIPAPAIETSNGVAFLQLLGVEPPEHVRQRIRHIPMQVAISCELKPIYPGSPTENCVFSIVAESGDGARCEKWTGNSWQDAGSSPQPKNKSRSELITLYDRSLMNEVPRLLEPLGLKYDGYSGALALRVTRKFPEIFVPWLKSLPPAVRVLLAGTLASLAEEAVSGQVRLDVTEAAIDWFDLHVVLDVSDTTLTREEIRLLLNAKGGYVRLDKKGWRRLRFNLTEEDDEKLARLGLNPHELTAEPQRLHALQLADASAKKFLPEQQVEQIQRRVGEIKARVTPELPGW